MRGQQHPAFARVFQTRHGQLLARVLCGVPDLDNGTRHARLVLSMWSPLIDGEVFRISCCDDDAFDLLAEISVEDAEELADDLVADAADHARQEGEPQPSGALQ